EPGAVRRAHAASLPRARGPRRVLQAAHAHEGKGARGGVRGYHRPARRRRLTSTARPRGRRGPGRASRLFLLRGPRGSPPTSPLEPREHFRGEIRQLLQIVRKVDGETVETRGLEPRALSR